MDCSDKYTDGYNTYDPDTAAEDSAATKIKFCNIKFHLNNPEIQELNELSIEDEWKNCKKPQGHGGFLPWQKFLEDPKSHLCKAGINDDVTTVDYIKTSGDLVVRLVVGFVSGKRPKKLYKSLFKHRETEYNFTGSGAVIHTEPSFEKCRCYKCRKSTEKTTTTWNVYISTATHVVFDHTEGICTTAELFYDSDGRSCVRKLYVNFVETRQIIGDSCILKCTTCDKKLYQDLTELLMKQKQIYTALPLCERPTAVIISHPHGMHKHISWGHCQVADTAEDQIFWMTSYKYKTTTCPGSSGAPVLILNDKCNERHSSFVTCNFLSHSGSNSEGNYSGEIKEPTLKAEYDIEKVKRIVTKELAKGKTTDFVGGQLELETDLHKHDTGCKKNPGHKGFIPVKDFNNNCLPERYRDSDVMFEYIKALATISGQCKTEFTSLERPEFYPGTQVPYPCYKDRGSHVMRLGTCCIKSVVRQNNSVCRCAKCQVSATPSKVYYNIYVACASHLVFDDSEAHQTTIVLGFDDINSAVKSLDDWEYVDGDIKSDFAIIQYITCDLELADKLSKMLEHLYDLEQKVSLKYLSGDVDKLTVVISHPHGCPKQVSVGEWIHKHQREEDTNYDNINCRFWYTSSTCPGSSGAAVYVLGQECSHITKRHIPTHVHSDNVGGGWNKSGYAVDNLDTQKRKSILARICNVLGIRAPNRTPGLAMKKLNTQTRCPSHLRRFISTLRGLFK